MWKETLEEIREGFRAGRKLISDDAYGMHADELKELQKKFDNGMNLFKKHFFDLWD